AADWHQPRRHYTKQRTVAKRSFELHRTLDDDEYFVRIIADTEVELDNQGDHVYLLQAAAGNRLDFVVAFTPRASQAALPNVAGTFTASADHWRKFWLEGAAVDLSGSKDPRAVELERRIVLSQYLTAIQCAGSLPPQETGLTVNSWYGKFHLEMHWWHAAH